MEQFIYPALAAGLAALVYAVFWTSWVKRQDAGDQRMRDIAEQIQTGAMAFIKAEYRVVDYAVYEKRMKRFEFEMISLALPGQVSRTSTGPFASFLPQLSLLNFTSGS